MTESVLAWHFVGSTLRDGRPVPADGEVLEHDNDLKMCRAGLHASKRLIDALDYAPGYNLCRVECSGAMLHEKDKLVAKRRVILWRIDAEDVLRRFARRCALDVAHLWDMPPIVREYLETGDETKSAATWAAAKGASSAAASAAAKGAASAAMAATWDAAWDAARAASSATRNAAWAASSAARNAAWAAAWAAARAALDAAGAASDAASDAAWDTAWAAQDEKLITMVTEARERL
jgi:hypothetical protein